MDTKKAASENFIAAVLNAGELVPINVIRTETVLSKLPLHNLSKSGKVEIRILRKNSAGRMELKWEVSHNARYGQPRQLAYKLDTLVVSRHIDEQRRPLPKVLRLGTLTQICADLDLPPSGKNINNVKRAILQNAGAMIDAKLNYRSTDGVERRLEAAFTRYSVIFTGERLPDGKQADGVYVVFNDPYWEVLNQAPMRPLDYNYLKELAPAPQRFYEILSYRMFVALKYDHPQAKLAYSDYCTCSAQTRYYDYEHFKKQMYKLHKPHLKSGYITRVSYEPTVDEEGQADWLMLYEPGPKARAEYHTFTRRSRASEELQFELFESAATSDEEGGEAESAKLFEELVRRGVSRTQANKLVRSLSNEDLAFDLLEWGDYLIAQSAEKKFHNPPGFYVHLLRETVAPPATFETSRMRQARQASQARAEQTRQEKLERERAYNQYLREEVGRYAAAHESEYRGLVERKEKELVKQYRSLALCSKESLRELAEGAAVAELSRRLPLASFTDFQPGA